MAGWLFAYGRASRQWHALGGGDIENLLSLWVHSGVRSVFCGLWFRCMWGYSWWIILWKDLGRSRGMNNKMWRYGLTGNRAAATSGRFRGEALRCVSTRRVTSRTGVKMRTANLEKTGSFVVKSQNRWPVFQCTVNWARARPKTALIASGAAGSSAICSV